MKKIFNNPLFTFILGAILFGSIGVVSATILYDASEVGFTPDNENWDVDNLENAINDLYEKIPKGYNVLESGTFTSGNIAKGGGYASNTITLQNSYTEDQKAIFVITKHVSESANSAIYIRSSQAFKNYVVGNKVSFYLLNSGGAAGSLKFNYAIIQSVKE